MVFLIRGYDTSRGMSMKIKEFWRRYRKNRPAVFGLGTIVFFVLIAIFANYLSPFGPLSLGEHSFSPPSSLHLMGTDDLGRDILSGVMVGSRVSLAVGFLSAAVSAVIGVILGAVSGYAGGKFDDLLMRIADAFMVIPTFFLAVVMVALWGSGIINIILVIGLLSWPMIARLVRAEYLSLKEREFVVAARAAGANSFRIIREIMPNSMPPAIVATTLRVGGAILTESGLSFLGLGDPNVQTWGYMLYNSQRYLRDAWWTAAFPGLSIFLVVLGLNLMGDGLNDALNPKLKER